MRTSPYPALTSLGLLGIALVGCPRVAFNNADHCANQDGDDWCQKNAPDRPFCGYEKQDGSCMLDDPGDGCYAEKPMDACYAPCGCGDVESHWECNGFVEGNTECLDGVADDSSTGDATAGDPTGDPDTSAGTVGETESGEDTTTGVPSCDGNDDCVEADAPFCGPENECVGCDALGEGADAACADKFTELGVCNAGACVECTAANAAACEGTAPICDESTFSCGPCTAHEQCVGSQACHIAVGSCFPETSVVHVDEDGGEDYETIAEALADRDDPELVIILHAYQGGVAIGPVAVDNRTLAIFAADGENPVVQGTGSNPGLTVENGASVYLKGIDFRGNTTGRGIEIDDGTAFVEQCEIVQNTGGGIAVSNNGYLRLVNCFVSRNGNDLAATSGLHIASGNAEIVYSSIVANVSDGAANGLTCAGSGNATVRNTIIVTNGLDSIACGGVSVSNSAIDTSGQGGSGNTVLDSFNVSWFEAAASGDLSLTPAGEAIFDGIARWRTGDPPIDIDGTPRPDTDETPDYAGADRPN